jgi:dUTPase.
MDRLESIMKMQKEYIDMLASKRGVFNGEYTREEMLNMLCTAMIQEVCELQNLTNWKWWKISKKELDVAKAREELIDIMHFLIHAMIVMGMDADTVHEEYKRKNEINRKRLYDGY